MCIGGQSSSRKCRKQRVKTWGVSYSLVAAGTVNEHPSQGYHHISLLTKPVYSRQPLFCLCSPMVAADYGEGCTNDHITSSEATIPYLSAINSHHTTIGTPTAILQDNQMPALPYCSMLSTSFYFKTKSDNFLNVLLQQACVRSQNKPQRKGLEYALSFSRTFGGFVCDDCISGLQALELATGRRRLFLGRKRSLFYVTNRGKCESHTCTMFNKKGKYEKPCTANVCTIRTPS